jgi:sigma-E factor negative regulatory protein RseC
MSNQTNIKHPGRIISIDGLNAKVLILSKSACSSCHAKDACGVMEMQEKEIDAEMNTENQFLVNETVNVIMKESYGNKAVFYGYVLPLIMVILSLIIALLLTADEALSGLISISVLIPYYFLLYIFRHRLKTAFKFNLERYTEDLYCNPV